MNGIIQIFLLAMTPVGELRAAIPVGLAVYRLHWLVVYFIAVAGNLVPAVLLLLTLRPLSNALSQRTKWAERFFAWLFNKGQKRALKLQGRQSTYWALAAFVAMPLPVTGAWTGALVSLVLGLSFRKSLVAIAAGVFTAGAIVTVAAKTGIAINQYFGWLALITVAIILLAAYLFFHIRNRKT